MRKGEETIIKPDFSDKDLFGHPRIEEVSVDDFSNSQGAFKVIKNQQTILSNKIEKQNDVIDKLREENRVQYGELSSYKQYKKSGLYFMAFCGIMAIIGNSCLGYNINILSDGDSLSNWNWFGIVIGFIIDVLCAIAPFVYQYCSK